MCRSRKPGKPPGRWNKSHSLQYAESTSWVERRAVLIKYRRFSICLHPGSYDASRKPPLHR
jgi:hypothetical protein